MLAFASRIDNLSNMQSVSCQRQLPSCTPVSFEVLAPRLTLGVQWHCTILQVTSMAHALIVSKDSVL